MAYKINLHDTHRTPYSNAIITAVSSVPGSTTPVSFEDYEGNDLGTEIRTNAKGFLCDQNGTLYTSGVFVPESCVITVTLGDGTTTSWTVTTCDDTSVNNAKLYNADKSKVLFTANADTDMLLSYMDLSDRPIINEWGRTEQIVDITAWSDSVSLANLTTVVSLVSDLDYVDYNDDPVNDKLVTLTLETNVSLVPFGQRICVFNKCTFRVELLNHGGGHICTLDPGKLGQLAAYSNNDGTRVLFRDENSSVGYSALSTVVFTGGDEDTIEVNDYSPNVLVIRNQTGSSEQYAAVVNMRKQLSLEHEMVLWWQPTTNMRKQNLIVTDGDGHALFKLKPYSPVTARFTPGNDVTTTVLIDGDFKDSFGVSETLSLETTHVNVPPDDTHVSARKHWPTGADHVILNLVPQNPSEPVIGVSSADGAGVQTVEVRGAINTHENFEQALVIVCNNADMSGGNWYHLKFTMNKTRDNGTIDTNSFFVQMSDIYHVKMDGSARICGILKVTNGLLMFIPECAN